jgi:hypothetical protein
MASARPNAYLFDRDQPGHAWQGALAVLAGGAEMGHAALAQNWRMDGRVDEIRQAALEASGWFPNGLLGGDGFDSAIDQYQAEHRRNPRSAPPPAYLAPANQSNRIPRDSLPGRKQRLVHFACLQRLLGFANSSARTDLETLILDYTGLDLPRRPGRDYADLLAQALQAQGLPVIQEFAQSLSLALGEDEPHWWATFSHEIGKLENGGDWTEAAQKIGQGYFHPGDWLIAWRYHAELAAPLYRPTVAEAGGSAFHFPASAVFNYGIAMPLAEGFPAVREAIHPPLKGAACGAVCIGMGRVSTEPFAPPLGTTENAWLDECRQRHGAKLARRGAPVAAWLARHGVTP